MESALTTKGQITIPKAQRERLNLAPGDRVKFFVHPDGTLAILPKLPASAILGIVRPIGRTVSLEEMDRAIAEGATRRFKRFASQ
jgi:antitoxin PrlF